MKNRFEMTAVADGSRHAMGAARGGAGGWVETLESRTLLSAGALDASFGTSGYVINKNPYASADDVLQQPDGKIVTVGTITNPTYDTDAFYVSRYNKNGTPDTTFGNNGSVIAFQDEGSLSTVHAAFQGSAIILVSTTGGGYMSVARISAHGVLDQSFGTGGVVFNAVSTVDRLMLTANGKILVAGNSVNSFVVTRFTISGAVDTSFGKNGSVFTNVSALGSAGDVLALAPVANGDFELVGDTTVGSPIRHLVIARYTTLGAPDPSFGKAGVVSTIDPVDAAGGILADASIQPNGSAVIGGTLGNNFAAAEYKPDGGLDDFFGIDGLASWNVGGAGSRVVAIDVTSSGKVLLAGSVPAPSVQSGIIPSAIAILQLTVGGYPDHSFGNLGRVVTNLTSVFNLGAYAGSIAVQSDGNILVAGRGGVGTADMLDFSNAILGRYID